MTQNNSSNGITACVTVCWLLAFAFGIFIAAALIGWAGLHGLVAAVIGLFAMLIAGWLLKGMFCTDEVSSSDVTPAAAPAKVVSAPVAAAVEPEVKEAVAKPKAKAAPKKAAAKKAPVKKPAAKKAPAKKPAAKKAAATKFYKTAPAKVDDLKLISGVGPKLEVTLNEIGVYQYAQVAVWKAADIKKVDDQLKFKGRIVRDDWMSQAKILAKGGETEFSKKKRK